MTALYDFILSLIKDVANPDSFINAVTLSISAMVALAIPLYHAFSNLVIQFSATPLEIAFMTKKQQQQYKHANLLVLFLIFFLAFEGTGLLQFYQFKTIDYIQYPIVISGVILIIAFLLFLLCKLCLYRYKKGYYTTNFSSRSTKEKIWFVLSFGYLKALILKILKKTHTSDSEKLVLAKNITIFFCFAPLYVGLLFFNLIFWTPDASGKLLLPAYLYSLVYVFGLLFLLQFMIDLRISPGLGRVMVYSSKHQKWLYLYCKNEDDKLIAGEPEKLTQCEEYYLLEEDDIIEKTILRANSELTPHRVNKEQIILQPNATESFNLEKNLERLTQEIEEAGQGKSFTADSKIYIKLPESKIYSDINDANNQPISISLTSNS